jgi:hypothetical protein
MPGTSETSQQWFLRRIQDSMNAAFASMDEPDAPPSNGDEMTNSLSFNVFAGFRAVAQGRHATTH